MLAEESLRQGNVDEALAELKKAVQQDPSQSKYRVFLFQLLSVVGKWDSALTQLEVSGDLDPGNLAMVQAYREAIRCENSRNLVFAGKTSPLIFGEPDRWVALLIQSLKHVVDGQYAEAVRLRNEALEEAPTTSGSIEVAGDDTAATQFEWIADADSRLGPILEVFLNGQYYWVPIHRVAEIEFETPADLRDFVWTPAHFTWANGGQAVGMIPTRYPGADTDSDPAIRLARKTDWQTVGDDDSGGESYLGLGQRMLATDAAEFSLLDIRKIVLDVEAEPEVEGELGEEESPAENGGE